MRVADIAFAWSLIVLPLPAVASPGDLDPAFGDNGKVVVSGDYFNSMSPVLPLRVREDGRILVFHSREPDAGGGLGVVLYQFNADGSPDLTFGDGTGKVVPAQKVCSRWLICRVYAFDLQPDGKIVVGLTAPGLIARVYAAGRLLANGQPDPSFGVNGGTALSDQIYTDAPVGIATLSDGGIVVGGSSYLNSPAAFFSAARFRSDGTPDTNFGVNGRLTLAAPQVPPTTFRVQSDGKLLWAGRSGGTFVGTLVVRALADGQLDQGFGAGGVYRDESPAALVYSDLAIQADGRLVLAGTLPGDGTTTLAAMRLTTAGTVDTTFGSSGIAAVVPIPGLPSSGSGVAFDSQSRVVLAGTVGKVEYFTFQSPFPLLQAAVVRMTSQGMPDLTFAPYGATTFWNGRSSAGLSITAVAGDKLIVGGTTELAPHKTYFDFNARTPLPTLYRLMGGSSSVAYGLREAQAVEFYHSGWDHYFVSAAAPEIASLDATSNDWKRSGKSFKVWTEEGPDALPVCRFFSDQSFAPKSSHFYTPYVAECDGLREASVWKYEGPVFDVGLPGGTTGAGSCGAGSVPLYRLYNNGQGGAPNHRYTRDVAIVNQMTAQGWVIEGDALTKVFACIPE